MDRTAIEGGLERVVRENRATIAVVFPIVGAIALVASASNLLPASLAFNPYLLLFGTLVMRLPLAGALASLVTRRTVLWLGVLVAYAYAIEWVGLTTGVPYGEFAYLIELGPMVEGVPVGLPVFFLPLILNAYLLAVLLTGGSRFRLPVALGLVLGIDLVLDPAAVALGFWSYPSGAYYGVPGSNYVGWLVSGSFGVMAVDLAFDPTAVRRRLDGIAFALDDFVSFVLLWGVVNALYGQWLPVLVATGLGLGLVQTHRFDRERLRTTVTQRTP